MTLNFELPLILNIETSGSVCSVSVSKNGTSLSELQGISENDHASQLTILITDCLKASCIKINQLHAVAVSSGPGSYTGLRIGVSAAKALCHALNIPLVAINTLQAMAYSASQTLPGDYLYCPLIDARRMEVYAGVYDVENKNLLTPQPIIISESPFEWYLENKQIVFFGNGMKKCVNYLRHPHSVFFDNFMLRASALSHLSCRAYKNSNFKNLISFEPEYLKAFYSKLKI